MRRRGLLQRIADLRSPLRNADYRAIWQAQVLSELGDWAARVALAYLVLKRTGSPALTASVTTVSVLPWVGIGQIVATLGDRFPRRRVLVVADLFRAVLFAIMAIPAIPVAAILALAFVAGLATPAFESSKSALVPEVVPEDCYGDALALSHMTNQTAQIVGFMSGGGLVALISPQYALIVNAFSFLMSALSLVRLQGGRTVLPQRSTRARLGGATRVLIRDPHLRRATLLGVVPQASAMAAESLVAVYVRDQLGGGAALVGVMAAVVPIGMIAAATVTPRRGEHVELLRISALLVLVGGAIAFAGFAFQPHLPWAAIPYLGVGVVFALVVPANTVVGARLPRDIRASAFGLLQGTLMGAQAVGALMGGLLASQVGVSSACALGMLPAIAYAAFAFVRIPAAPPIVDPFGGVDPVGPLPDETGAPTEAVVFAAEQE